jgi:hypothetical protein
MHFSRSLSLFAIFLPLFIFSQHSPKFDDYFLNQNLRIDYFHTGDAEEEFISIDHIYLQGEWAGNPDHLIDPFNTGRYFIKVYDATSYQLLYSRGFDSYFGEYKTTDPAKEKVLRTYHESALIPCPKKPILFVVEIRGEYNLLEPLFREKIDPAAIDIIKENPGGGDKIYPIVKNGDPHKKVDIVLIAEGYTAAEEAKFKADLERYATLFFEWEPYKNQRKKFNLSGIFHPSPESGMDEPRKGVYKNTALSATFNSLNSQRYLLTEDNKTLREIAAQVPYDAIFILVNSKRYGGGGIYNTYCITTVDDQWSDFVFHHEFGHTFAGLADEYYAGSVAYNEFYPPGIEPTDANITALLDLPNVKWKDLVSPGMEIPTDWNKGTFDSLYVADQALRTEKGDTLPAMIRLGYSKETVAKVEAYYDSLIRDLNRQIEEFIKNHPLKDKVGAFEGAGYSVKGLYRPMLNCLMLKFDRDKGGFCEVCEQAVLRVIAYYSE